MLQEIFTIIRALHLPFVILGFVILSFIIGAGFIIYHLLRFGIGIVSRLLAVIFIIAALINLIAIFFFYNVINWNAVEQTIENSLTQGFNLPH